MEDVYNQEKASVKQQQDAADAYEERLCGALRRLAGTREGAEFLCWLMDICGTLKVEYPTDHIRAAWNAGSRNVGAQMMVLARKAGVLEQIIRE